ncbi:unnamed protein product [Spirodela intermedia]|uniref:Uncharacterized protein n=1 Tax=Spirodela intermedia TaxID=51605 RepID=A0A7I8IQP5_SPIIN|nr:unnamed protein product [Spirodela intermedia]CAA6660201.1 unnamed protein product [Spirodela intermedia]
MGIEVLALSLPSPASQDRLSSSHQASTRGVIELGSLELSSSHSTQQASTISRFSPRPKLKTGGSYRSYVTTTKTDIRPLLPKNLVVAKHHLRRWDLASSPIQRASKRQSSSSEALLTSGNQDASSRLLVDSENVGVLLLNLGGPETLEDVQPFLFNLFSDPDIIRLPRLFRFLQKPLAKFISVVRAPKSKEGYASIGGGSPLRLITDAQV